MLWQRVLTAAVSLPVLLYTLILGKPIFVFILFGIASMLATFEFSRMFYAPLIKRICKGQEHYFGHLQFFVVLLCALYFALVTQFDLPVVSLLLLLIFIDILVHFSIKSSPEFLVAHVLFAFVAIGYCCLPWILLWDIYEKAPMANLLVLFLVIVMASDTGAYFIGSRFGKRKFCSSSFSKKIMGRFHWGSKRRSC